MLWKLLFGLKNSFCLLSSLQNAQQPASSQHPGQYQLQQPSVSAGATSTQTVPQTQSSQMMPMPQAAAGTQVNKILSSRSLGFLFCYCFFLHSWQMQHAAPFTFVIFSNGSKTFIQITLFLVHYSCHFSWEMYWKLFLSHVAVVNKLRESSLPCRQSFQLSRMWWGLLLDGVSWTGFQNLSFLCFPYNGYLLHYPVSNVPFWFTAWTRTAFSTLSSFLFSSSPLLPDQEACYWLLHFGSYPYLEHVSLDFFCFEDYCFVAYSSKLLFQLHRLLALIDMSPAGGTVAFHSPCSKLADVLKDLYFFPVRKQAWLWGQLWRGFDSVYAQVSASGYLNMALPPSLGVCFKSLLWVLQEKCCEVELQPTSQPLCQLCSLPTLTECCNLNKSFFD